MPDPAPTLDPPSRTPRTGALRPGRFRLSRFGSYALRHLNLAGMLVVALVVTTADFALAGDLFWNAILTGLQAVFAIPWVYTVVTLDRADARLAESSKDRAWRTWRIAAHVVLFGALTLVMAAKALVVEEATRDPERFAADAWRQYVVFVFALLALGLLGRGSRMGRVLASVADHPARLMAITFGVTAVLGGFLLTLPVSLRDARDASFVDGLFTSMSAVCVTGLVVNDVGATYTFFGQFVLLLLMQIGGLGIMVLSAAVAILAGRRLRARGSAVLAEMIDADSVAALRRSLKVITLSTLAIEAVGAVVLFFSFPPEIALPSSDPHLAAGAGSRLWAAVFHSVSAFCNAGFSLAHGNLLAFTGSWPVCLTIGGLITLGGIGFPVMEEIAVRFRDQRQGIVPPRLSLHTRVVLATSAGLVLAGTAAFLWLEWGVTMHDRPGDERLLAALFQSVSTRTAGFNSLDFGAMGPPVILFSCFLMFVGASPGSTGGGIKTTTFSVLLSAFRAEIRSDPVPRLYDRALPAGVVRKALGVAVVSIVFTAAVSFLLLVTEGAMLAERYPDDRLGPLRVLFETVSAFATCGLSTGITPHLSVAGKLILTFTMFVGRIGPLTFAVAAAAKAKHANVSPPEERVLIG